MLKDFFKAFRVNRVVKYFVSADLILFSGWGLVSPVFSIFVTEKIIGATLAVVGTGAAVYWITRSTLQLPLGSFLDKTKGEKVSLYTLLGGLVMTGFSAFSFIFINEIWQFYTVQFIHGFAIAMYSTAWNSIYSNHLDKNKVAFEWALDGSFLGFASGITGFIGGYVSDYFGFSYVFQAAGYLSLISAVIIFLVPDLVLPPKTPIAPDQKDHTPRTTT